MRQRPVIRLDTGAIIVGIISAIQAGDRFHISRKHTTAKGMRQASEVNIIKLAFTKGYHRDHEEIIFISR